MNNSTNLIKDVDKNLIPVNPNELNISEEESAKNVSSIVKIDTKKIKNRSNLGAWLAGEQIHNVLSLGVINQEIIEKCLMKCASIMETSENEETVIKAIIAANQLVSTSAMWASIQIKVSEISGQKNEDSKRDKKSPLFTANNLQVNLYNEKKDKQN